MGNVHYWSLSDHERLIKSIESIEVTDPEEYKILKDSSNRLLHKYRGCAGFSKEDIKILDDLSEWFIDPKSGGLVFTDYRVGVNKEHSFWCDVDETYRRVNMFAKIRKFKISEIVGELKIDQSDLKRLPKWIPDRVGSFDCSYNKLTSLRNSPNEVTKGGYDCSDNLLRSLDGISSGITRLDASNNKLDSLSEVKGTLDRLNIAGNEFKSLESLPAVKSSLNVSNNHLTSIKGIPMGLRLKDIHFGGNPVSTKTFKILYAMLRKTNGDYGRAITRCWKDIPQKDRLQMYKDHPGLSENQIKAFAALNRYESFKEMI